LLHTSVKSHRKATGRIILAKEHFSDCRAALLARIPGLQNGLSVLLGPVHRQRAAVQQDHDERLARRRDSLEQRLLHSRQVDIRTIRPGLLRILLSLHRLGDPDTGHDDVGIAGRRNRRLKTTLIGVQQRTALRVLYGCAVTHRRGTNALQRRHRTRGCSGIVPNEHLSIIGIGADHCDLEPGLKRKRPSIVLEKHHRFAGNLQSQRPVFFRVVHAVRYLGVGHHLGWVEHPQAHAREHQPADGLVDRGFVDIALFNRAEQV